jgi:acrylyl-CoA reductase (NADPH)
MSEMPERFAAFVATKDDDEVRREVRQVDAGDLGDGDVAIRVAWSSVNFKDGLATIPKGQVARISPLIPGIDMAGTVVESSSPSYAEGEVVLAHGYALGVAHHGGYAQYARVPAEWVVPLEGLSPKEAMTIGTAGFTAAMSVQRIQEHGITPDAGPVLVTGASGGVGSMGVDLLAGQGYEVVASTGDETAHDWLRDRGAAEVIDRLETDAIRPLGKQRWAVDRRAGRRQRQHRRHGAADLGRAVHPARCHPGRDRLRQLPDRGPPRPVGSSRRRHAAAGTRCQP